MTAEVYEVPKWCGHCSRDTPHRCETRGHERDGSWDRETCLAWAGG